MDNSHKYKQIKEMNYKQYIGKTMKVLHYLFNLKETNLLINNIHVKDIQNKHLWVFFIIHKDYFMFMSLLLY